MTRILIADGQLSFCHHLRQMLARRRDIQVIGDVCDAASVSRTIQQLRPDVLLIDLALCQQAASLGVVTRGLSPQRTIVMLESIDNHTIVEAFRYGAHGILMKTAETAMWGKTVRRVMDGQYCFENGSMAVLLEAYRASFAPRDSVAQREYGLTARELDIVAEIAAGRSNLEVGQRFSICERTVKHHLTSIFGKVGVSSRLELAMFAVKHRLVAPESSVRQPVAEEAEPTIGQHSAIGS
jgi:DNA-binding NarL/FixJ family response regulator